LPPGGEPLNRRHAAAGTPELSKPTRFAAAPKNNSLSNQH
jgi:hypothetical protein